MNLCKDVLNVLIHNILTSQDVVQLVVRLVYHKCTTIGRRRVLPLRAGSNPQMDRLRYSADVHVSLDDEEMREVDPDEHREALGAGIPQHLGLNLSLYTLCQH